LEAGKSSNRDYLKFIFIFVLNPGSLFSVPKTDLMNTSTRFFFTFLFCINLIMPLNLSSQNVIFTRQDTLRGSITAERAWWDLTYYHLDISVNPSGRTIEGTNTVTYRVVTPDARMQIDLQEPMQLIDAVQNGASLKFIRDGNVYWIDLKEKQEQGKIYSVILTFAGKPRVSTRPPWVGGLTWSKDKKKQPFVATSCQGDGASLWWPCKDHMYDEPDSMLISVNVPENLMDVSNGRLRSVVKTKNNTTTYNWFVANSISNYSVNINIGDYAHFSEIFQGEKGALDCDYYVLKENLEKAKRQFTQVPKMLAAFEHWFGPYPFYEDGYKLVEAPYLGMEHQSSVTYGNGFKNGYRGTDLSGTGWGLKFDFIIIHESGHEWFANSITYEDIADMWVHESFTNYSENLYVEYYYGKAAGSEYLIGTRAKIKNDRPITGIYNVNNEGSGDMYYKGGNMLHTLRQILGDDEKWRAVLRGMNKDFYHQVVKGSQIENYLSEKTGIDLNSFFDQYLRDVRIPKFEYYITGNNLTFRWNNCVPDFRMPLKIYVEGKAMNIFPTVTYATVTLSSATHEIAIDKNYYVEAANLSE
jgi:aminopeptidase N